MSAGSTRPFHVDIEFESWYPEADLWLNTELPSTGMQLVMAIKVRGADDELARYAEQKGMQVEVDRRSGIMRMMPGPMPTSPGGLVQETILILGAAGGIGGVAAVLKVFFERNNGKKVTFGQEGEVLGVEGLSTDEIVRLLETLRDQRVEEESARTPKQKVLEAVAEQASGPSLPHRSRRRGVQVIRFPPR